MFLALCDVFKDRENRTMEQEQRGRYRDAGSSVLYCCAENHQHDSDKTAACAFLNHKRMFKIMFSRQNRNSVVIWLGYCQHYWKACTYTQIIVLSVWYSCHILSINGCFLRFCVFRHIFLSSDFVQLVMANGIAN